MSLGLNAPGLGGHRAGESDLGRTDVRGAPIDPIARRLSAVPVVLNQAPRRRRRPDHRAGRGDRQPARRYVPPLMPRRGRRSYSVVADPDDQRRAGIPGLLRADGVNRRTCCQPGPVRDRPTDAALDSARRRSAVPVVRTPIMASSLMCHSSIALTASTGTKTR